LFAISGLKEMNRVQPRYISRVDFLTAARLDCLPVFKAGPHQKVGA
jgi:hypothetical protein